MDARFSAPITAALSFTLTLTLTLAGCGGGSGRETAETGATQVTGISTAPATEATEATGGTPTSSGSAGTSEAGTGSAGESAGSEATSSTATTGGGPKFDLPPSPDVGNTTGALETGCTKVDFLFVIDNSTSMEDQQAALIASFPGFIDAIKTALGDVTDYHVMVVDTDAGGRCAQPCDPNDVDYVPFCSAKNYYACTTEVDACDNIRGAGVVEPVGSFASNKQCKIAGGHRYMTAEEPDLLGAFACVAKVGTAGSPAERPMNAIEEAIGEGLNFPDGCNGGFLRDDAILVATFLSDDGNYVDKGAPADWKAAIVAAKHGDENAAVIAGLIPHPELDCINKQTDGTQGSHWQEFIELWGPHGVSGSICAGDYAPFFAEAVAAIDQTCKEFNPPG